MPSICYEGCSVVVVEAFAAGLPVIAARLGALAEFVQDGITGPLFEPGNATDLAAQLVRALTNLQALVEMGRRARLRDETDFTPGPNHHRLMSICRAII